MTPTPFSVFSPLQAGSSWTRLTCLPFVSPELSQRLQPRFARGLVAVLRRSVVVLDLRAAAALTDDGVAAGVAHRDLRHLPRLDEHHRIVHGDLVEHRVAG